MKRSRLVFAVLCAGLALLPACRSNRMSPPPASTEAVARFEISARGSIRHRLVSGPRETRYEGPPGPDHELRRTALDYSTATPPAAAAPGKPGPHGSPWRFHDPGRNEFVEFSAFYPELRVVEYYAFTELVAAEAGERAARLWTAGAADLWINGGHVARHDVTRYRNPDARPLALPLKKGVNRLCVRLQCLGLRDMRMLFGLFLDDPSGLFVAMPGAARVARAEQWIDSGRAPGPDGQESAIGSPLEAHITHAGSEPFRPRWSSRRRSTAPSFAGKSRFRPIVPPLFPSRETVAPPFWNTRDDPASETRRRPRGTPRSSRCSR